jgi:WD40 repeat protein
METTSAAAVSEPLKHAGVRNIIFLGNGKHLATVSDGGTMRLWDVTNGIPLGEPLEHAGVTAIVLSGDGQRLATRSKDMVRLWDATNGAAVGEPLEHAGVKDITFSGDGKRLVRQSRDGQAQLWDVSSSRLVSDSVPQQGMDSRLLGAAGQSIVEIKLVSNYILRTWWLNSPGEHLLSIACARLPMRETASSLAGKQKIATNDSICTPATPAPDWARIAKDNPVQK